MRVWYEKNLGFAYSRHGAVTRSNISQTIPDSQEEKADALFIAGHYKEGALIARQAQELGMGVQILGMDGIGHPEYIKVAGKAAGGAVYK